MKKLILLSMLVFVVGCNNEDLSSSIDKISTRVEALNETIKGADIPDEGSTAVSVARIIDPNTTAAVERLVAEIEELKELAKTKDEQERWILLLASIASAFAGGSGVNFYKNRKS